MPELLLQSKDCVAALFFCPFLRLFLKPWVVSTLHRWMKMHVRLWNMNGYFKFCIKINRSEIIRLVKQIIFYAADNKSLMMKKSPLYILHSPDYILRNKW